MPSCDESYSGDFNSIGFDFDVFAEVARETDNFLLSVKRRLLTRGYEGASLSQIKSVLVRHPDLVVKAFCGRQQDVPGIYEAFLRTTFGEPRNSSLKCEENIYECEPYRPEIKIEDQTQLSSVLSSMNLGSGAGVHNTLSGSNTSLVNFNDNESLRTAMEPDLSDTEDRMSCSTAEEIDGNTSDADIQDNESVQTGIEPDLSNTDVRSCSTGEELDVSNTVDVDICGCQSEQIVLEPDVSNTEDEERLCSTGEEPVASNTSDVNISLLTAVEPDLSDTEDGRSCGEELSVDNTSDVDIPDSESERTAVKSDISEAEDKMLSSEKDEIAVVPKVNSCGDTNRTISVDCRLDQSLTYVDDNFLSEDSNSAYGFDAFHDSSKARPVTNAVDIFCDFESSHSYEKLMKKIPCAEYAEQPGLDAGSRIQVSVLSFNDPNDIVVQRLDLGITAVEIENKLSFYLDNKVECSSASVRVGSPVVFVENDSCFRAIVANVLDVNEVCIYLVDRGIERDNVPIEQLSLLLAEHAHQPPLSVKVTLNVLDDNKNWDKVTIDVMTEMCIAKWKEAYLELSGEIDMKSRGYLCGDLVTTDMSFSLKNELNLHLTREPVLPLYKNLVKIPTETKPTCDKDQSATVPSFSQHENHGFVDDSQDQKAYANPGAECDSSALPRKTRAFSFIGRSKASTNVTEEDREKRRLILQSTFPKFYGNA